MKKIDKTKKSRPDLGGIGLTDYRFVRSSLSDDLRRLDPHGWIEENLSRKAPTLMTALTAAGMSALASLPPAANSNAAYESVHNALLKGIAAHIKDVGKDIFACVDNGNLVVMRSDQVFTVKSSTKCPNRWGNISDLSLSYEEALKQGRLRSTDDGALYCDD